MPADLVNDDGQTPLHLAVSSKDLAACQLVVANAASSSLHTEDKHGNSPVDLAMAGLLGGRSGDDGILDFLVQQGSAERKHEAQWFRAFCSAICSGSRVLIDVFVRHGRSLLDRHPTKGGTALHFAVHTATASTLEPIDLLVQAGVDVNAVDNDGVTALHIAAQRCDSGVVRCLIKHGAMVDAIDSGFGGTPLTGAIFGAKVDNARVLIDAGASAFHKVKAGRPLLHLAAQEGQREILELLITKGVPASTLDELGHTAAYWACQNGHLECIKFLVSQGLDLRAGKTDLMEEAITKGHIPIVEFLWKRGLPITESRLGLLHGSEDIHSSRWDVLYFLLRHVQPPKPAEGDGEDEAYKSTFPEPYLSFGFPILAAALLEAGRRLGTASLDSHSGALLLFTCAQHGFVSGTQTLLRAAPSLDEVQKYYAEPHGWRGLEIAVCKNNIALVKLFLEHGWDPNREDVRGRTSLHLAALCGASDVVEELLGECNIHHRDKDWNTPVHLAASCGSVAVLELLTGAGGDVNKQNKAGETPLGIACEQGHTEAVRWLLDHGSRCQMGHPSQSSPLHHAARLNNVDCMNALITSGSNVNAKCAGGNTPLHTAAKSGAWKAVSRLLEADADPNCLNHQGMTPLALALSHSDQSLETITKLLEKTTIDWDAPLSQNILFTACVGGNKPALTAVFARLNQARPNKAKKTVRRLLPELLAELCSSGPAANSTAFPFLLEYMHSSSKEVLSTTILVTTIRAGDDAELAQTLVNIDPENAYLRVPGLWTMLHFACQHGRLKIARVLLANGAPAWAKSESGMSPLGVARKYLKGDKLKDFVNLFRAYDAALDALREDEELQELIWAAEIGMLWDDDDEDEEDEVEDWEEEEDDEDHGTDDEEEEENVDQGEDESEAHSDNTARGGTANQEGS
jgi:ankyrin repeat protein